MTYEPVAKSSAPKLANTPAPLTGALECLADRVHGRRDLGVLYELVARAHDRHNLGRVASGDAAVGVERLALGSLHGHQVVEGDLVWGGYGLVGLGAAISLALGRG